MMKQGIKPAPDKIFSTEHRPAQEGNGGFAKLNPDKIVSQKRPLCD